MENLDFTYRNHDVHIKQTGWNVNGLPDYTYKIDKKYLGFYLYKNDSSFAFPDDCIKAAKTSIDDAFNAVEQKAKVLRELTSNDFKGFVKLLTDTKDIPSDQVSVIAVEMLKAHYQRLNIHDNDCISTAIDGLSDVIKKAFDGDYDLTVGSALMRIAESLEK